MFTAESKFRYTRLNTIKVLVLFTARITSLVERFIVVWVHVGSPKLKCIFVAVLVTLYSFRSKDCFRLARKT